jgi:outer membrane protein TolC
LQEVEDALVSETRQWENLRSLESQLELAETVLARTRDAYLGGQADYLRVLDALISQQSLRRRCLTARRLLIQYRINLSRALGGSWMPELSSGGDTLVTERKNP